MEELDFVQIHPTIGELKGEINKGLEQLRADVKKGFKDLSGIFQISKKGEVMSMNKRSLGLSWWRDTKYGLWPSEEMIGNTFVIQDSLGDYHIAEWKWSMQGGVFVEPITNVEFSDDIVDRWLELPV